MQAIGSYIFAGGFTVGVAKHFDVLAHLEQDNYGVPTFKANFPSVPVAVGPERWAPFLRDLPGGAKRLPFWYGNPPCKAFSQAGKVVFGGDWRDDPSIDCHRRHFGFLEEYRPRVWATESVTRIFTAGRELIDKFASRANELGYRVYFVLHDAQYLGVPQRRRRFFMVASEVDLDFQAPTFEVATAGDTLRKINDPGEQYQGDTEFHRNIMALVPDLKPGENMRKLWESRNKRKLAAALKKGGTVKGRPSFADYYRIRADGPSNAVAGYSLVHPEEHRCLTIRELAALCGFPPMYEWVGSGVPSQIARGVCPGVAEWLAQIVRKGLERNAPASDGQVLVDFLAPPGQVVTLSDVALSDRQGEAADAPSGAAARASRPAAARKTAPPPAQPRRAPPKAPVPKPGLRSGAYIKLMLSMERYTTAEIVAAVRLHYPASKATQADVACNKGDMRKAGHLVGTVRELRSGERKLVPYAGG